jgi:ABC-type antimicrobial peptide transport system permease subunit
VAGGVLGVVLVARMLRSLLNGVSPADPLVLGGSAAVLFACAALALVGPVRRATRADPIATLR